MAEELRELWAYSTHSSCEDPGGGVLGGHAPQARFQLLVHALCLPIGLRVEAGGQTGSGTQQAAELLPKH